MVYPLGLSPSRALWTRIFCDLKCDAWVFKRNNFKFL